MERVKQGEFALLGAAQSVYSLLEKQVRPVILLPGLLTVYHVMQDASCDVELIMWSLRVHSQTSL